MKTQNENAICGKPVIDHLKKTVKLPASFLRAASVYGSEKYYEYMEMQKQLQDYHFVRMQHKSTGYKPSYTQIQVYFEITGNKQALETFLEMKNAMTEVELTEEEMQKPRYQKKGLTTKKVHMYKPFQIVDWVMRNYDISQAAIQQAMDEDAKKRSEAAKDSNAITMQKKDAA